MLKSKMPEFLTPIVTGEVFCGSSESDSTYYSPLFNKVSKTEHQHDKHQSHSPISQVISPNIKLCEKSLESDTTLMKRVIRICEAEAKHRSREKTIKRIIHECKSAFINSQESEISLPAYILLDFILTGLSTNYESGNFRWDVGKGTAAKYLEMLYEDWLSLFKGTGITEYDEADFEDIYESLLVVIYQNKNKAIRDLLPLFFQFIAQKYSRQVAMPEFLSEENGISFVRSRLIDEFMFQQCLARLLSDSKHRSKHFRRSLEVLFTLVYRLGLRPKEAFNIKLKNISLGSVCEIEIHRTKKSGKSISANRRVEASLLLHDYELQQLKQLRDMRYHTTQNANALLFSQESFVEEAFNYDVLNKPATEILSEIAGYRVVFYQCRHSAVTNLMTICFAEQKDAKNFTSYDDYQIERIKEKFFINQDIVLDQISAFFGHLVPSTTINSYTHRMELCMLAYQQNLLQKLDLKSVSRLSNITMKRLREEYCVESGKSLLIDEQKVFNHVSKIFDKYLTIKHKPSKTRSSDIEPAKPCNHWHKTKPNIATAIEVGELLARQRDVSEIASCLLLDTAFVEHIKDTIIIMRKEGFKATKADTSLQVDESYNEQCIIPFIKPQERETIVTTSSKLLSFYNQKHYPEISRRFLAASPNHSYVLFSELSKLVETIKLILKVCDPKDLLVRYDRSCKHDASSATKLLKRLLPEDNIKETGDVVQNDKFHHGRFYLHYQNDNKTEYIASNNNWQKYSSSVLRSSFFWIEVYEQSSNALKTPPNALKAAENGQLLLF